MPDAQSKPDQGSGRMNAFCVDCDREGIFQPVEHRFGAWICPVHRDLGTVGFAPERDRSADPLKRGVPTLVFDSQGWVDVEAYDRLQAENEALKGLSSLRADAEREVSALNIENAELREELGYRPRENNGYCMACGCYMPQTLDGTKRVHDCDRTPPLGKLPTTIYACPTCAGHAPFSAGCWGTTERPHEHVFMRPIHELVRAAVVSDETHPTIEDVEHHAKWLDEHGQAPHPEDCDLCAAVVARTSHPTPEEGR